MIDGFVYNLVNYIYQLEPKSIIIFRDNNISIDYFKSLDADKISIFLETGHS